MSNQHGPRFAKETLQGRLTSQASCSQIPLANHHYRDHKAHLTAESSLQIFPCSSIRLERNGTVALSQKGNTCIQTIFTQSSVSLTTTPKYLPVSGFNVPSLHLSQSSRLHPSRFHKTTATIQVAKVIPDLPVTLNNCSSSGQQIEKHESKLTTKFPVSFQNTVQNSFHFLHSSGRFH